MSGISDALKTSLSGIIDRDAFKTLEQNQLFEKALTDEALETIDGAEDAKSLDQEELLEIIGALEGQLATAEGDEKAAIEQAIQDIYDSLDEAEAADERDVNLEQNADIDGDGQVEELGEYLSIQGNQDIILAQFDGLDDLQLQADILKYYFNEGHFDLMQQLLGKLPSGEAADLIAMVAENE